MSKSAFKVFEEMNQHDTENGTQFISMGTDVISATYSKSGTKVTIGIGGNHTLDLLDGKCMAILLIVDREEYKKLL